MTSDSSLSSAELRGASADAVERAISAGDSLSGTAGFAGRLGDGRLVRDVLGRQPIFVEGGDGAEENENHSKANVLNAESNVTCSESGEPRRWGFAPEDLADPRPLPAGHVLAPGETVPEDLLSLPDPPTVSDGREAVVAVRDAIAETLASISPGTADGAGDLAVAFSGGVDSAVVASAFDAPLYVVGFPESHDVASARRSARLMGREDDLEVVELSPSDLERAVPRVAQATGRTNAMDVQISLPLFLAAERAAADGFDRLAVGQGADELFGGYAKVARAPEDPRVEAETVRGAVREVMGTLPDQLERDVLALRGAGVEPVAPLLDDRVVRAALRLPGDLLVDSRGERKKALRLAGREFVPDPVAFREKKAVQYGSLVARELDRLARQDGFKRRMDDHVSKYVASRVE
ncbi:asparagine synthase C-terminal domain-containing protein [Halorussus lipolyticus]|uniref:asparagine synthase C-terminal domain-containing protein n=1 Tax=Halorussus lipolyticus TaxID=3034024 RepID=UPI0023E7C6FA|nr:asparagine synthase-related protein [Halorussus sp. DT80]